MVLNEMQAMEIVEPGSVWVIDTGWKVFGCNGQKIGSVQDVQPSTLVVSRGFIRSVELDVPVTTVRAVENQCVYLNRNLEELQ